MLDRDGRGGGGAGGGQVVAADAGGDLAGVGIEEEDRGLVVAAEAALEIVRPVAAGLDPEGGAGAVEAALEAVERVGVADRLADHGEIVGVAAAHGGEDLLDRDEGVVEGEQARAGLLGDDDHGGAPSAFGRPPVPTWDRAVMSLFY